jgi:hypothetical protein
MEHLPAFITASTVGALIAVGNFLLALTGPAAVLSPKRRIAANIKQIFQICEHSEKDIAKQRLQEKADALILRYAALTLIRYSPWELAAIIFFYATLIGLFAAYFFIGTFRHRLNGLNEFVSFRDNNSCTPVDQYDSVISSTTATSESPVIHSPGRSSDWSFPRAGSTIEVAILLFTKACW